MDQDGSGHTADCPRFEDLYPWQCDCRAKAAPDLPKRAETMFCRTCGGEFDAAEWRASTTCPECESPKRDEARPADWMMGVVV